MKVLFKADDVYLIRVNEALVYCGNGKDQNGFGDDPFQFLRFNPYMREVSKLKLDVPENIRKVIEKHLNGK